MKKKLFVFICFVYFCGILFAIVGKDKKLYEVIMPKESGLGNFITVKFNSRKIIQDAEIIFLNSKNKELQTVKAFPIDKTNKKWVCVVGIPAWWEFELCNVKTKLVIANRSFEKTESFAILPAKFDEITMVLGKKNTRIIYKKTKAKTEQEYRLDEILKTTNRNSKLCSGYFILPFRITRISSGFGQKRISKYSNGKTTLRRHWGVDYPAPVGTIVNAPCGGKVVLAENREVTGNTIVLEHLPGVYTLYYHLNKLYVGEGAFVEQGIPIGEVGTTGYSTGPHLHWELRINGIPVNPQYLLGKKFY